VDLAATILDAAGAPYPSEHRGRRITPLEGESFLALLHGKPWARSSPICWEHLGNKAVREERLKLVCRHPGRWELYDMVDDRTELNDLAARFPEQTERMAKAWEEWAARCEVAPWEELRRRKR
jgi:arylsulfatase